jgi:ribosome-associated toxin RatA of RatAB toxin-antitoxin module
MIDIFLEPVFPNNRTSMHRVDRSVLVPFSTRQMFELVARIEDYPKFLPWCSGTRVRRADDSTVEATVEIHYRGVRASFTTLNRNCPHQFIAMQFVDGPFRRLHGEWTFRELREDACRVHLSLHYQFAQGLLGRAVAPVFESIATTMIDSFTQRAEAQHGQ